MRLLILLLATTGLVFAAPVPKDKKKADAEQLLGKWELDKVDAGKDTVAATREMTGATVEFKADGVITVTPPAKAKEAAMDGTVKLDETAKLKEFDVEVGGQKVLGVYELDGDKLTFCISPDMKRPKEMKADETSRAFVVTLKRVKADEKKDK